MRRVLALLDAIAALIAVLVMFLQVRPQELRPALEDMALVIATLIGVGSLCVLALSGQYTSSRRLSRLSDIGKFANALVLAGAATLVLNFVTKGFFTGVTAPSRLSLGIFVLVFFALGVVSRLVLTAIQRHMFVTGHPIRTLLLLGDGPTAADFMEFVETRPWLGVAVAGRLASDSRSVHSSSSAPHQSLVDLPVVGRLTDGIDGLQEIHNALVGSGAQELIVALEPEDGPWLSRVTSLLSLAHVPFKVVPSLFEQSYKATELLGYAGLPVIDVEVDPLDRASRLLKRTLDLAVSLTLSVVLLPLGLFVAIAIVMESGLPVIYKQERVGRHGRRFHIYKFRTMVKNADQLKASLESQNEAGPGGQMFKMRNDPRITRVGAFLRKFSLDELPQLANIISGDMSLVGPRPPLPAEVQRYEQEHLIRLKGLPGVTGLWQVSGRSNLSFEDMVRLDRYYLENWSISLDIIILVRTILVVLRRDGAY